MRPLINDPFHNPFQNRFNVPVHHRHDEMQAQAYMVWLKERNQLVRETEASINELHSPVFVARQNVSDEPESRQWGRLLAVLFVLVLALLISVLTNVL